MHFTQHDLQNLPELKRLNMINALPGIKPVNLIGTISGAMEPNLTIISSLVHISSDPPLLGFFSRPSGEVRRHTYENITDTGVFTINQVHQDITTRAHYTSAKFDKGVSEFEQCGLTREHVQDFAAPFVRESRVKAGLHLKDTVAIALSGTVLMIGEIVHLFLPDDALKANYGLDLERLQAAGVSGLYDYYSLAPLKELPYARISQLPDFNNAGGDGHSA